ncbi:MAG: MFS transporter [Candidatus Sumerlaeaceae bacterium]
MWRKVGMYRWVICALLFFSTTVNYIDRQVLSILGPDLKVLFKWSEQDFARINMAFQLSYAVGLLFAGRVMDRFGSRLGLGLAIGLWSIAAMAHAGARSAFSWGVARFGLGITEAGNFPAAVKSVAEWFPKRERALAIGVFNSGSNVGAIAAPLVVPWLAITYGWQWAFIATGGIGLILVVFWVAIYRRPSEHPKLSAAELAYINSDPPEASSEQIPWGRLFPFRQTWAFALGKMMTDPIWWFFLFWLPSFLKSNFNVTLREVSLPLVVIYLAADVGSVGGGWLSSRLIKNGFSVNRARKTAMLVCALCVVPVFYAAMTDSKWVAIGLIALALAAHQGWSANLFTLVSDTFPRRAVGSVVGIGGMMGGLGGVAFSETVGRVLKNTGQYFPMFVAASCAYLFTLLIIHLLVPRLEPAPVDEPAS